VDLEKDARANEGDLAKGITWTTELRRLGDLREWEENPRILLEHDANELDKSLTKFNLADPLIVNLDNTIIGGHQRRRKLIEKYGVDHEVDCRVPSRLLSPEEMRELAIRLNRNQGKWDFDLLANNFELGELLDFGFEQKDFGFELPKREEESEEETEPEVTRYDVPDAVWASDNDWGVPLLDANLQALACDLPFKAWGSISRKSRMSGTWHFYTEDYRYEALWRDPSPVANTRCLNVVEPNYSCYDQMARAFALFQIYRKRWLARWWQSLGIRVFVDLNVAERFYDLNLLGVPKGWSAWATRGYTERVNLTEREYQIACDHAGTTSILFVVYGGGKAVKQLCMDRGWLWFDEQQQDAKGD